MNYESPFNMLLGGIDTYDLLWEYDGTNFTESTLENAAYDVGVYIELDIHEYTMLYITVSNLYSNYSNNRVHILINDPSIPYQYVISDMDNVINKAYRFVTVSENGLYFSTTYACDGYEDDSSPYPVRIYGIR